ncbi:putative bifunctional diguanylate cyclase/phosphodiesterase [Pseudomarimonas salicorniae]|uniref:EAL domain-containing protein n=1 Tax=Pseudomarimonas salicorniae TaxID=2933270 RepID=A0ABT0GC06_9GAMM|nr:EAL domain-containing protein [Lysobacter sp. CAU 1642]MCK7592069.1 EAL domain-containing protein [Lysobacter sp. CAU 1642]
MTLHRLLLRQLRRHAVDETRQRELAGFLHAVSQAYEQADTDRNLLDRSLQLTSRELVERYEQLQAQLRRLESSEEELRHSLSLLHATLDASGEGMAVFALDGKLVQQNKRLQAVFQLTAPLAADATPSRLIHTLARRVAQPAALLGFMRRVAASPEGRLQAQFGLADGRQLSVFTQPQLMEDRVAGRVWCFRDITEQHRQEQRIRHQAEHDSLTGLPNRARFEQGLALALERASAQHTQLAVMFIDLDHFKRINDSHGHQVGDQVLAKVAAMLHAILRDDDLLARMGGDEFILLLDRIDGPAQTEAIARRITDTLSAPLELDERRLQVQASVGIALYPQDGAHPAELISRADMAMYEAKLRGRSAIRYFAPGIERQRRRETELHEQLAGALERGEFRLVFQPQVLLADGALIGAEALLRWTDPMGRPVSPTVFVPAAERSGLIRPLGDWVLGQALDWLCRTPRPDRMRVAVNLSARQLDDPQLAERILDQVQRRGLGAERLELEVTESMLMENREACIDSLRQLRAAGVRIAVDDFGTGYSSLNYLRFLPIDVLKIDRSFVKDMADAEDARAIVRSIIDLARNLGLEVVAEGIEDALTASLLLEMGCPLGQGYHFGRPADALPAALAATDTAGRRSKPLGA